MTFFVPTEFCTTLSAAVMVPQGELSEPQFVVGEPWATNTWFGSAEIWMHSLLQAW